MDPGAVATTYARSVVATFGGAVYVTVHEVNALPERWHVVTPSEPWPAPVPLADLASANRTPERPPASASLAVIVTVPLEPSATFSGVSGCRNPGVTLMRALADTVGSAAKRAVTFTGALSTVR